MNRLQFRYLHHCNVVQIKPKHINNSVQIEFVLCLAVLTIKEVRKQAIFPVVFLFVCLGKVPVICFSISYETNYFITNFVIHFITKKHVVYRYTFVVILEATVAMSILIDS